MACCVPGSKSLTRCLGMPPSGEIANPMHKNTPSALDVNDFEMPKRKSLSADYMRIPSIENGAAHLPPRLDHRHKVGLMKW
jgi:hypothetical protein